MRTALSRVLLAVLLGVAVVVAVRSGSAGADGVVAIEGVGVDRLEHGAFRLDAPAVLAVDAAGSFEEVGTPASDTTLAALAWVVRRADGAVVWRMRPPRPGRGTFASVQETVRLPAGTYDAYFASLGDPLARAPAPGGGSLAERLRTALNRSGRAWRGDAGRWRLVVRALEGGAAERVSSDPGDGADRPDSSVVWHARSVRSRDRREGLFEVAEPSRVRVSALVEVADGVLADSAYVVRLGTRDTVWAARPGRTAWAGGSLKNRLAQDEVALAPGLYHAVYVTDRDHAYGSWTANPPWAPWQWGMEVRGGAAVRPLDPGALRLPEVEAVRCPGPDEEVERVFTLDDPSDVLVVAVGEVVDGTRYDWGGLDRQRGDRWDEVWEMERRGLDPAGGSRKNRRAAAPLTLEPGTYRLRYETDGSHDCQSGYNDGGGPDGGLWGIVVYALDPGFDSASVGRPAPPVDDVVAEVVAGEGGADQARPFTLDAETRVEVVGEDVSLRGDPVVAPWITDGRGARVWELDPATVEPVDGVPFALRYRDVVRLPAGSYVLHYDGDARGIADALASLEPGGVDRGVRVLRR